MAADLGGFIAYHLLLEPETITWVLFLNGEVILGRNHLSGWLLTGAANQLAALGTCGPVKPTADDL